MESVIGKYLFKAKRFKIQVPEERPIAMISGEIAVRTVLTYATQNIAAR